MTTTLLRTKFYIPRPARRLVARSALIQRLNEGLERDLSLVVAPVGYGKTTLLAMWAAQAPLPVAWLTLSESDDDLLALTTCLIAAIRTQAPGACPQTQSLLESAHHPDIEQLATLLINEIDDLAQRFVLVMDDYHLLQAPAVHQLLDSILRHPPLQMHLLIASRADPPLALARLRAGQRLAELRIRELRFSQAEAEAFLTQAVDLAEPALAMPWLTRRTEGWIAGLQLAALSLRTADDPGAVLEQMKLGSDRFIMDYLFEQVLHRQPPAVQEFLLKTAILEQVTPALAQAVLGDEAAPPSETISLAALESAGVFVSALDNRGEWYSYHALFRELLRHHLQQRCTPAEIAALHRRASGWLRRAGLIDEALHHALAAHDDDLAATLIIDHFSTWLEREHWPAIERWLGTLPPAAFTSHPWLLVASAHVAQLRSNYAAVPSLLAEAEARLAGAPLNTASPGEAVLSGYLDLLRATNWLLHNQPQQAIEAAQHALQSLPAAHRYVRGTALQVLTITLQISGEMDAATQLVQEELARTSHTPHAHSRLRLLLCLMSLYLADGQLAPGEEIAARMLKEATVADAPISQLWGHLALGSVAYEADDLPGALRHFTQGAELRHVGHTRGGHESLIGLALTCQRLGRIDEARSIAGQLVEHQRQFGTVSLAGEGIALQLHLEVLNGAQPGSLSQGDRQATTTAILLGWRILPAVTCVHAWLNAGTPGALAAAHPVLDELIQIAEQLHKPARRVEFLALKSRLYEQQGRTAEADAVLRTAVALSMPRGLVRSLVDAGAQLGPVLRRLAAVAPSPYLMRVLAALRPPAVAQHEVQPAAELATSIRLTRREREVLALLIAYKTDREIAEQLVVSPLTVRTHIEHLSEKLGVNGRRAIVARATELNLLG